MLVELIVENYAVVERTRIHFHEGLNLLTGETGSGKSIVVDALGLLLGARASADAIRTGSEKARVAGIFSVELTAETRLLLEQAGIEDCGEEIIVEREVATGGKSRAFIVNRPVTTGFLRQLAPALADIHGQNDQQSLFSRQTQRLLLDKYAGAEDLGTKVSDAYKQWHEVQRKLDELMRNEQENLRLLDLWRFQKNEIEAANLKAGEDEALETERRVLLNATKLQEITSTAFNLLYEAPENAVGLLRRVIKRLDELVRIDDSLAPTVTALTQADITLDEASWALRAYLEKLEGDPSRLEDIENRLHAIDRLKRKYGGDVDAVLKFLEEACQRVDEIENSSAHQETLAAEKARLAREFESFASELSRSRKDAAERLAKQVENELKFLAMAGTQFRVRVMPADWSPSGIDDVEFLVSPNRGEELRAMERIASGGELSRISLALRTAIGDAGSTKDLHTLVFDEVDAGVGGAAAAAVGRRLKTLSFNNQVICVTHLAQIAGFADHHFAVKKAEKKGRVVTDVRELSKEERAHEIGRMLSGETITADALRQAEQLMQAGERRP